MNWFYIYSVDEQGEEKQLGYAMGGNGTANFMVPAGNIRVQAERNPIYADTTVTVEAGKTHEVPLELNAGHINLKAILTPGGEPAPVEWFYVYAEDASGKQQQLSYAMGSYGYTQFTLKAGTYTFQANNGSVVANSEFEILPAQTTNAEINLNAGYVNIAVNQAGQPFRADWVYSYKRNADGSAGDRLAYAMGSSGKAGFMLPAGPAIIQIIPGGNSENIWQPVDVVAGENHQVDIEMP